MAICDHCGATKTTESDCGKCGESGNREDYVNLPSWMRKKIREARKKRTSSKVATKLDAVGGSTCKASVETTVVSGITIPIKP